MSVFQYQDYRNPYGPSIAEALAHQADPQAAAALRAGDIQARADERQAALRGQLFTQLGAIPGEIQASQDAQQKRAAQQQQLQIGAQTLQENQLTLADRQAKRDAEARIGKQLEATPRGPNGTYDLRTFTQGLSGDDLKYVQPYLEHLNTVNTAWENEDAKRRTQLQQGATALLQAGAPFLPTQNLIDTGERDRVLTADQATSWRRQLLEDPAGAKGVLAGLAGYQKPITKKDDEALVNPVTLQTVLPSTPKSDLQYEKGVQGPNGEPLLYDKHTGSWRTPAGDVVKNPTIVKDTTPKSYQKSSVLLDGKPAEVLLDPTPGGKVYDLSGAPIDNAATRIRPIPPASVQVLNQTLQGGQHVTDTAKAIAEYRVAPPSSRSLSTPAGELLMTQVMTANPSYDATQFPTRQKMRQAFTSGPQSQTINSLNTAIGHLDQFTEVVKALDNGNFQPGNQAYNWLRTTFGQSAPTNFAGIRSIMSGELAAAFKKSGATDQEIASVEQAIASKNSTGQLLDYVQTIALPALGSKVVSFDQQYRQVMGASDPFQILLPESAGILQKYGIDPAHPTMGARPPTGTAPAPSVNPFRR